MHTNEVEVCRPYRMGQCCPGLLAPIAAHVAVQMHTQPGCLLARPHGPWVCALHAALLTAVRARQAAAELAKARAAAAAAAEAAGPQVCDSWEWMVEGVLREVLSSLDFPALKRFRLTCARWRAVADRNLQARCAGPRGSCGFHLVAGLSAWSKSP